MTHVRTTMGNVSLCDMPVMGEDYLRRRNSTGQLGAPAGPGTSRDSTNTTTDPNQQQKLRLACKMEILDFYVSCDKKMANLAKKQSQSLGGATVTQKQLSQNAEERADLMASWKTAAADPGSVAKRLKQLDGMYAPLAILSPSHFTPPSSQ